jgi:hypothetical protein
MVFVRLSYTHDIPMKHQIFKPNSDLATLVKFYWSLESPKEETPVRNTIVPDGCMKLIFHYGDLYKHYPEERKGIYLPKCFLIGQLTKPYEVEPTEDTGTFFVCFHPNGFFPFATASIKGMENTAVPLDKLFGKNGQEMADKILDADSTAERIKIIESFLFNRLRDTETVDRIVKSTVETILEANGQFSVNELSKQNNIDRRQLVRKFSTTMG